MEEEEAGSVCGTCLGCCRGCLSSCLERLGVRKKDKKYPDVQYQPPGRAQRTFEIPEFTKPPVPGQTFEFSQTRLSPELTIHPTMMRTGVTTDQPTTTTHRLQPWQQRALTPEGRRSQHAAAAAAATTTTLGTPKRHSGAMASSESEESLSSPGAHLSFPWLHQTPGESRGAVARWPETGPTAEHSWQEDMAPGSRHTFPARVAATPGGGGGGNDAALTSVVPREDGGGRGGGGKPTLVFALYYDVQGRALTVHVRSASNLPRLLKASDGRCSSFVVVHLLPNSEEVHCTQVVTKSLDPVYDESLKFGNLSSLEALCQQSLVLKVFQHNVFRKNEVIGGAVYSLRDCDLFGNPVELEILGGEQFEFVDVSECLNV